MNEERIEGYTHGPWWVADDDPITIYAQKTMVICSMPAPQSCEDALADARLIAKAPEHYEELLRLREERDDWDTAGLEKALENKALRERVKALEDVMQAAVTQYPLIHGTPVPAWIRNLSAALQDGKENANEAN